jgi:hypothetical protein
LAEKMAGFFPQAMKSDEFVNEIINIRQQVVINFLRGEVYRNWEAFFCEQKHV